MEGPAHLIAINFCPLPKEERIKNQQLFCTKCPLHDSCMLKASKAFNELKESVYLKPYQQLLETLNALPVNQLKTETQKLLEIYSGFKNDNHNKQNEKR